MAWRYYLGFKLSNDGRQRVKAQLESAGYTVLDYGWDWFETSTQLSAAHKTWVIENIIQFLLKEESV